MPAGRTTPASAPGRTMDAWHDFYATAGGASAALVGLLFVGILFLTGAGGAMLWLMAAVFVLLGSSAQNAWGLLIDVAFQRR